MTTPHTSCGSVRVRITHTPLCTISVKTVLEDMTTIVSHAEGLLCTMHLKLMSFQTCWHEKWYQEDPMDVTFVAYVPQ